MKLKFNLYSCIQISIICSCLVFLFILYQKHIYLEEFKARLLKNESSINNHEQEVLIVYSLGSKGTILLMGEINYCVSSEIIEALKVMEKTHEEVDLFLNTEGGNLFAALAIADAIKGLKIKVNTYAVGICLSAGTNILCSGTGKRVASIDSIMSVHFIVENTNLEKNTYYNIMNKLVVDFWRKNAKLPDNINPCSTKTYFLSPEKAISWGIINSVF